MTVPFKGRWRYSRAELIADGVVHAVGIALAAAVGSARTQPVPGCQNSAQACAALWRTT